MGELVIPEDDELEDDEILEDEEDDLAIELLTRLTQFYQEAMVEAGLTEAQRRDVSIKVMFKQIADMQDQQRMMDDEEDVD